MTIKKKSTAISTAALRAIESYTAPEQRLFRDPFARPLCGPFLGALLSLFALRLLREPLLRRSERRTPGVVGLLLSRFAYLDDVLRETLADGVQSVIILGAGLDSRAYRIPCADAVRVFEVDHPSVQDVKRARLRRHLGELPSHVRFVSIDFDTQDLAVELAAASYDPESRSLFIWEGVSQYVSRAALESTLRYVGGTAAGNLLAFSYVLQRFIDDRSAFPELHKLWDQMREGNDPLWKCGLRSEHIADTLAGFSLSVRKDTGPSEHLASYPVLKERSFDVSGIERIVLAEVRRSLASM